MSRKEKIKCGLNGNGWTYKKYYCSMCKKSEVKRRIKFCEPCGYKRLKVFSLCIVCGKEIIGFKSRPRKFCSHECTFASYKGSGNPHFIDGRKPKNKIIRDSQEYKKWRSSVFERDGYTCQHCCQVGGNLHADHIKSFSQYPNLRLDINNGRTLCKECHMKTDTYLYRAKKNKIMVDTNIQRVKSLFDKVGQDQL